MMLISPRKTLIGMMAAGFLAAIVSPVQAQDNTRLVMQVQELLEEVRELRGQLEAQQQEIENLRRRQRDQYLDLDHRIAQLTGDGATASARPVSPAPTPAAPRSAAEPSVSPAVRPLPPEVVAEPPAQVAADVPEVRAPIDAQAEITPLPAPVTAGPRDLGTPSDAEQAAYDRAFRALRETRYADAAAGFTAFLDQFPQSAYAPNALYWLAETYYVTRDFSSALQLFNQLLEQFPGSNKHGDALLKIGFSHFELRQWSEARAALEQVRTEFPGSTLARLAEGRLRDMRLAGHF